MDATLRRTWTPSQSPAGRPGSQGPPGGGGTLGVHSVPSSSKSGLGAWGLRARGSEASRAGCGSCGHPRCGALVTPGSSTGSTVSLSLSRWQNRLAHSPSHVRWDSENLHSFRAATAVLPFFLQPVPYYLYKDGTQKSRTQWLMPLFLIKIYLFIIYTVF